MRTFILTYTHRAVIVAALLLCLFLATANLIHIADDSYLVITCVFFIVCLLIFLPKNGLMKIAKETTSSSKRLFIILLIVGAASILTRFAFVQLSYLPFSDPSNFFIASASLAEDGTLPNPEYPARYPYVLAYDSLLMISMKLFGSTSLSVIALNTVFDIITCILLYLLVNRLTRNQSIAIISAILWMANPFNIIFSTLSLPIIVVNTLIIASLLLVHLTFSRKEYNSFHTLILALVTGCTLAVMNQFRPLAIIFIIAIIFWLVLYAMKHLTRRTLVTCVLIFFGIVAPLPMANSLYLSYVSHVTGLKATEISSGWSIFVGSNIKTSGHWNNEDARYFAQVREGSSSLTEAHFKMRQEALERYSSYTPIEVVDLIIKKAIALGGDQQHSIYNLASYPGIWTKQGLMIAIYTFCAIFSYILILLSLYLFYSLHKASRLTHFGYTHYLALVTVGLFLAFLLVEVANRYFTPFFVMYTIFASLAVYHYANSFECTQKLNETP